MRLVSKEQRDRLKKVARKTAYLVAVAMTVAVTKAELQIVLANSNAKLTLLLSLPVRRGFRLKMQPSDGSLSRTQVTVSKSSSKSQHQRESHVSFSIQPGPSLIFIIFVKSLSRDMLSNFIFGYVQCLEQTLDGAHYVPRGSIHLCFRGVPAQTQPQSAQGEFVRHAHGAQHRGDVRRV